MPTCRSIALAAALLIVPGAAAIAAERGSFEPLYTVSSSVAQDSVVEGLWSLRKWRTAVARGLPKVASGAAFWGVVAYEATDFSLDVGISAVDREDRTLGAKLILINADAAVLKGLRAQGVNLNTDPRALAAKQRLTAERNRLEQTAQGGPWGLGFAAVAVGNHLPYAVANVGADRLREAAIKKVFDRFAPFLTKAFPIGDEIRMMIGNRSSFASALRYAGWRKLGARANAARAYTDAMIRQMVQSALDAFVKEQLSAAFGRALDDLYREVMDQNPSAPAPVRMRRLILSAPQVYAPAAAHLVAAQAPVAAAAAAPLPVARAPEPVLHTIGVEDRFIHISGGGTTARTPDPPQPQAPPPPEPPRRPFKFPPGAGFTPGPTPSGDPNWDGRRR